MSMQTEAERYNFIQEKSGLSKTDFAQSIGLIKSHGSIISTGRQKLSREYLLKLAQVYHVDLHWFLTGKGPSGIESDTAEIERLEQEAAAGRGREIEDYTKSRFFQVPASLIAPHRPDRLQAVYVAGDSMIDEKINDGDIAIFHPGLTEGNGIYVVSIGNSLVVKRVDRDISSQTIVLISANPAYEPRHFTGDQVGDIYIVGRVVACYHRV
jgi:phage repressor protein C with HTH and peptisase S24 domain